jgi:hypothetical protein
VGPPAAAARPPRPLPHKTLNPDAPCAEGLRPRGVPRAAPQADRRARHPGGGPRQGGERPRRGGKPRAPLVPPAAPGPNASCRRSRARPPPACPAPRSPSAARPARRAARRSSPSTPPPPPPPPPRPGPPPPPRRAPRRPGCRAPHQTRCRAAAPAAPRRPRRCAGGSASRAARARSTPRPCSRYTPAAALCPPPRAPSLSQASPRLPFPTPHHPPNSPHPAPAPAPPHPHPPRCCSTRSARVGAAACAPPSCRSSRSPSASGAAATARCTGATGTRTWRPSRSCTPTAQSTRCVRVWESLSRWRAGRRARAGARGPPRAHTPACVPGLPPPPHPPPHPQKRQNQALSDAMEMAILSSVTHPNIVQVYACLTDMVECTGGWGAGAISQGGVRAAGALCVWARCLKGAMRLSFGQLARARPARHSCRLSLTSQTPAAAAAAPAASACPALATR